MGCGLLATAKSFDEGCASATGEQVLLDLHRRAHVELVVDEVDGQRIELLAIHDALQLPDRLCVVFELRKRRLQTLEGVPHA